MHAGDRGGKRKSEPGARSRTRVFQPDKSVEHPRSVRRRNPRTAVGDRERDGSSGPLRCNDDVRFYASAVNALVRRSIFERVVDQIGDRLTDQFAIATDLESILGVDGQRHTLFLGNRFVKLADASRSLADVERLKWAKVAARFSPRDQQERVKNADQLVRFFDRLLQRLAIGR